MANPKIRTPLPRSLRCLLGSRFGNVSIGFISTAIDPEDDRSARHDQRWSWNAEDDIAHFCTLDRRGFLEICIQLFDLALGTECRKGPSKSCLSKDFVTQIAVF